jgi:prophage DNA circulation protein
MAQTLFQSTLLNASFKGFPFFTKGVELKGGRRNAPHQYPFRDTGYTEDLGKSLRTYVLSAFLVGDDLNFQYQALLGVLESDAAGQLVTPSTGAIQVICAQFETIQSTEAGRVLEIRMTFIEAGSLGVPVAVTDYQSSLIGLVASGIGQALTQFASDTAKTITGTLLPGDNVSNTPPPIADPASITLNTQGDLYAPSIEGA